MDRDDLELAPRLFHPNQWQSRFLRLTTTSHLVNLLLREDHRSGLGTAGEKQRCVGGSQWGIEVIMRCIPACLVGPTFSRSSCHLAARPSFSWDKYTRQHSSKAVGAILHGSPEATRPGHPASAEEHRENDAPKRDWKPLAESGEEQSWGSPSWSRSGRTFHASECIDEDLVHPTGRAPGPVLETEARGWTGKIPLSVS